MLGVIINTYALISTVPFVSFFLLYYLLLFIGKSKKIAMNLSIHITSILLYTAVTAQLRVIFNLQTGYWITISWVILIFFAIGFFQVKLKGSLDYKKLVISTSKLSFLTLGFFYIIFFIVGLFTFNL